MKPVIGITMGDAAGIGPEIIVKALADKTIYDQCRPIVIGDCRILQMAAEMAGATVRVRGVNGMEDSRFHHGEIDCVNVKGLKEIPPFGRVSADAGNAAYAYIERAVELAHKGEIQAVCTAPLNKEALQLAGHRFPGHTEILAHLTGTEDYSMMLATPKLKVIHLTTHVGLLEAIERINPERTWKVVRLAHETLRRAGLEKPRIAVCGINPHAGENGLFGNGEEEEKLLPGIEKARAEGIEVSGPHPADTLFFRAVRGDFDIVVACYHDQGHGPVKVLGIEEGVNITVGLKGGLIRTSVDHGTAFDIAWKNLADARSMKAAIRSAVELAPRE